MDAKAGFSVNQDGLLTGLYISWTYDAFTTLFLFDALDLDRDKDGQLNDEDRAAIVRGETYSLSRMSGAKTKEIAARLGDPKNLLSVDEAKAQIGAQLTPKLEAWAKEEQARADKAGLAAQFQREQMVQRQRQAREKLKARHEERWLLDEKRRAERTPRGIRGLWGWVTGKNRQIRKENEAEIARNQERDRAEKQETIRKQLAERRNLQRQIKLAREKQQARIAELNQDVARAIQMGHVPKRPQDKQQERKRSRDRGRARDRGPDRTPN